MANKKFWLGMLVIASIFCGSLTSCWSSGKARETLPQTAVTIQRVRVSANSKGAEIVSLDTPMKVFIDNNEPLELANGEAKTIIVNNGEHH